MDIQAMSWEETNQLLSAFQALVVVIAAAVGAFWALYRFFRLRHPEVADLAHQKAGLEQRKLDAELAKLKYELRPVPDVSLSSQVRHGYKHWAIEVAVTVSNKGQTPVQLHVGGRALMAAPIHRLEGAPNMSAATFAAPLAQAAGLVGSLLVLQPGDSQRLTFLVRTIPGPGLYLVAFRAPGALVGHDGRPVEGRQTGPWCGTALVDVPVVAEKSKNLHLVGSAS